MNTACTTPAEQHRTRATWPPERFYWSVLDAPPGTRIRAGPLPIGVRHEFEEEVPEVEADPARSEADPGVLGLHAVCATVPGNRIIVCAAPIARLRELGDGWPSLGPSELPGFIVDELSATAASTGTSSDPARIALAMNLLVGDLEPAGRKALRARRRVLALAVMVACCVLASIGLLRREAHEWNLAHAAELQAEQAAQRMGQMLSVSARVTPDSLPAVLAVAQRSAEAAARVSEPTDATGVLADLLSIWPHAADGRTRTLAELTGREWTCDVQSLSVSSESIVIAVTVEGDASGFLRAMSPPPGWVIDEPRLTNVGRALSMRRPSPAGASDAEPETAAALTRIGLTLRRSGLSSGIAGGGTP